MHLNSVAAQSLWLQQLTAQNNQTQNTGAVATSGAASDGSALSNPAQFFSQLQQLSAQDPTDFKNITAQIAQQLTTASANSTDPNQAAFLKTLAGNFQSASQTGEFSSLVPQPQTNQPQQSSGAHHGHHHHAYAPSSSSSDSSTQDTLSSIFSEYGQQVESLLSSPAATGTTSA
jgi:hypothetical protein